MMIAFFMKFHMIFSIAFSLSYVLWGFCVANQLFSFWFFSKCNFFEKREMFTQCFFVANQLVFRYRSKFTISFWNEKLFVSCFFIGNENWSFSEEIFKYDQCKENDSNILKSWEKSPPGFHKILFTRPQSGTDARAKKEIF